ncbi:rac GTPase-activating protein 1-like isoform X2 [Rhopilema esculentum]|uniref:rac GTPase-activating protein 1-like isoform X2 n=1 Tax=Rhopilema esculentum TaxID=499914 RepID=UPI0031DCB5FC
MSSTQSIIRNFDDLVRCSSVLTEGIEGEFLKFVKHQEECRQKWIRAEQENVSMKQSMAKLRAEKDTLNVHLKHARNQLENEMQKRTRIEQEKDHLARQLSLIKDLLCERDSGSLTSKERDTIALLGNVPPPPVNRGSYGLSESFTTTRDSIGSMLSESEYDKSGDDILMDDRYSTDGSLKTGSKRGKPSAPPVSDGTETDDLDVNIKKTRVTEEVVETVSSNMRLTISPGVRTERLDRDFNRPPPQKNRRLPTKGHLRRHASDSDLSTVTESDKENNTMLLDDQQIPTKTTRQITKQVTDSKLYPKISDSSPMPQKVKYATLNTPRSRREKFHSFVSKTVVKPETCFPCGKKISFTKTVLKCKDCKVACHPDCKAKVPLPCIPTKETPMKKKEGTIESYVPRTEPKIPFLVVRCIQNIESRGLDECGIYRVSGAEKEVKELRDKFIRGKSPDLSKYRDIHVICGTLKDFLRSLTEPLVTFALHEAFSDAATSSDVSDSAMFQCVSELPPANRDTLAYLMVHLQKVAQSPACQMPITNLAKVLGPTIVGHRSCNPTHLEMFEDLKVQPKVVERLISLPTDYWNQFLLPKGSRQIPYNPGTHHPDGTPLTPDIMPAPESMLGPVESGLASVKRKGGRTPYTPKYAPKGKEPSKRPKLFESPHA